MPRRYFPKRNLEYEFIATDVVGQCLYSCFVEIYLNTGSQLLLNFLEFTLTCKEVQGVKGSNPFIRAYESKT